MDDRPIELLPAGFEGVIASLRRGAILFLDYDGTLVPIAERPELAVISSDMRAILKSLARRFRLVIISGRAIPDTKKLVGLNGIYYVGNHGFEISGPGIKLVLPEAASLRRTMARLCNDLQSELEKFEGAIVEDKGLTASVHYRLVARSELGELRALFKKIVGPYLSSGAIKVTAGKRVMELRPNLNWDKGNAVLWILDMIDQKKKLTPLYIGDDQTDEDAFLALKDRGITFLVSEKKKKTHAKFFLKSVEEVKQLLKKLTDETGGQF